MHSPDYSQTQARNVCRYCKVRKRRCDKILPSCSACARLKLTCNYGKTEASQRTSSSTTLPFNPVSIAKYDDADDHFIDYPTALFLDPSILKHGPFNFTSRTTSVPLQLRDLVGTVEEVHLTVNKFLEHIHSWLPFISKIRLQQQLRSSFYEQADIILLLLAIKLITTSPPTSPRNPRTSLYHVVKHFFVEVEGSCALSLPILQAGILVTLYEISHGIYPAGFLSISGCARFAHAIGIKVNQAAGSRRALTLLEMEERSRAWWAIVILDRFVTIGCPGRPLVTADPEMDDFLPADAESWDEGTIKTEEYSRVSTPMATHMGKFALLCQAARLLGQVFNAVLNTSTDGDDTWLQLNRTLQSMLAASLDVASPDTDQITMVYSALTALNAPWLPSATQNDCIPPDNVRSKHARQFVQLIANKISSNLVRAECLMDRNPEEIPPWGMFFAYRLCVTQSSSTSQEVMIALRNALSRIASRWNVAGVYLQLIEAQDVLRGL